MALRLDNVGIVVEDLEPAIEFFRELGLELEGRGLVEGEWAGGVTGLGDQTVEIAMMRTPDGNGRLEAVTASAEPGEVRAERDGRMRRPVEYPGCYALLAGTLGRCALRWVWPPSGARR